MKRKLLFLVVIMILGAVLGYSQNQAVVAILDFKNATGERNYNYLQVAIPEMLATNLASAREITVLERDRVEKILKEHGLLMAGVTEGDEKKIGKLLAARQLLSGTVIKTGKHIRIDARLTEVATGKIVAAAKRECRNSDEIIDAVDLLSESIVNRITGRTADFQKEMDKDTAPVPAGEFIDLEVLPQNKYCASGTRDPFYFRAGFYAKEVKQKKERLPLNLCVVLDRSGSMGEAGKLTYAKEALKFIVKNLTKKDLLSIVTYDDRVDVFLAPTLVEEKDRLLALIDKIETGGSTNLSGGMLEGYNQVKKNWRSGQVNRVLLLSDGLANVGVTDPNKIQQMVRSKTKEEITISTFGLGQYFNEVLMTGIAEYGNANYYYINKPDMIPDIFTRELSGLLSVVAQNCTIEIEPLGGAEILEAFGYKFEKGGNNLVVKLGDIISGEKKLALLKITPPGRKEGEAAAARVIFAYDDAVAEKGRVVKKSVVTLAFTGDRDLILRNVNPVVMKDVAMFRSSAMMEKAIEMVDKGDVEGAKKKNEENLNMVRSGLKKYQSRELKKQALNIIEYQVNLKQMAELPAAEKSDFYQYNQKSGRDKQYKLQKRK